MTEEEEVLQILEKGSIKEHLSQRLKNAPQVMLSGHRITIEIEELDEFYIQKAKEELRETPEIVAQSIKELKELIAGEINVRITDTDEFYTIFLRCCKWHAQKAFSLVAGGHVIIDLEGLSLSQVSYFSPSFAKMVTDFIQTALPCRLKSINIVNQSFLFNVVFALFKPFLQV
ncbi:Alpha-tocopherol transfer protein-like [Harpegnathos saltator]|uniref:Alpha-tocopherol transfer protein-like n=1 Tax=Harpegnathos saltator TaxID=610380 RepID=E2C3S4_HARSA|nr:Alpha-tocopherol transfer protein-like [Harpegnathos saltator]